MLSVVTVPKDDGSIQIHFVELDYLEDFFAIAYFLEKENGCSVNITHDIIDVRKADVARGRMRFQLCRDYYGSWLCTTDKDDAAQLEIIANNVIKSIAQRLAY
jgi:hypothetical protein